jgi:hypothetical protein
MGEVMIRNRNVRLAFLAILLIGSKAIAGGTIDDPGNYGIPAGWSIQPYGSLDAIHQENGDTIELEIIYTKPMNAGSGGPGKFQIDNNPIWWAPDSYPIPGGDFIGGTWHVVLLINNMTADIKGGFILEPME